MALHEILTRQRVELGISLDEIVARSGVAKGTVSKIMSGNTPNPQIESLKAIAYALGLTLDDLDETSDKANAYALSPEALKLARIYDKLDNHSQRIVYTVATMESERKPEPALPKGIMPMSAMPFHDIPNIGTLNCTGELETKYAARQELAELESSPDITPVD